MASISFFDSLKLAPEGIQAADLACQQLWEMGLRHNVWEEICSEFDARRLSECLRGLKVPLSETFQQFETSWLHDENSHYLGFRRLYSTLYGVAEDTIRKTVEERESSFAASGDFLADEFNLLVLLAYDEIVTAKAYARDFVIYDQLGEPGVSEWIRQVCRDEGAHCRGAVDILRTNHCERLATVPGVLDRLIAFSSGSAEYTGSFVLDHQSYPRELIESGRQAILALCRS